MANTFESEAYFTGRLATLKLSEFVKKFEEKEWITMANFAYGISYMPGRTDEAVISKKVYEVILGQADHPREHAVRRLFHEAQMMAEEETKRRINFTGEEGRAPRKIPIEERGARWKLLVKDLDPLKLNGELEPSYALIDKYCEMEELNEIKYLKWEEHTKREQEQHGVKKIPLWAEKDGVLTRQWQDEEITFHAQDRLDLMYLLQRRGLALDMAHLISYRCHQTLVSWYFEEMARESVDPERYEKVSITQCHNADREIFIRMSEEARDGFRHLGNIVAKEYPLDKILTSVMKHPRVQHLMNPWPKSQHSKPNNAQSSKKRDGDESHMVAENKKLKNDNNRLSQRLTALENGKGNKGKGKGKGKDKGKGKGKGKQQVKNDRATPMPKELWGMNSTVNGNPLCFSYNMKKGCSVSGEDRCKYGYHLCAFPGCAGTHSLQNCPKK